MSAVDAFKKMKAAGEGVNGVMKILNGTLAANPFALVAGLVAGLGVALFSLANSAQDASKNMSELDKLHNQMAESIKGHKESWEELLKTQQESINNGMTEMSHIESLVGELDRLTDANGKVKEGYEGRAQFITGQLASALGIEISYQDGIIQGYQKIRENIDQTIEKKKAEIILNSQEAAYTEALQKRGEVVSELTALTQKQTEMNTAYWIFQQKAMEAGPADASGSTGQGEGNPGQGEQGEGGRAQVPPEREELVVAL